MARAFFDFVDVVADFKGYFRSEYMMAEKSYTAYKSNDSKFNFESWRSILDSGALTSEGKLRSVKGMRDIMEELKVKGVKIFIYCRISRENPHKYEILRRQVDSWLRRNSFHTVCKLDRRLLCDYSLEYRHILGHIRKRSNQHPSEKCCIIHSESHAALLAGLQAVGVNHDDSISLCGAKRSLERLDSKGEHPNIEGNCDIIGGVYSLGNIKIINFQSIDALSASLHRISNDYSNVEGINQVDKNTNETSNNISTTSISGAKSNEIGRIVDDSMSCTLNIMGRELSELDVLHNEEVFVDIYNDEDMDVVASQSQEIVMAVGRDDHEHLCCLMALLADYPYPSEISFATATSNLYNYIFPFEESNNNEIQDSIYSLLKSVGGDPRRLRAALLYLKKDLSWGFSRIKDALLTLYKIKHIEVFNHKDRVFERKKVALEVENLNINDDADLMRYIQNMSPQCHKNEIQIDNIAVNVCFTYYHLFLDRFITKRERFGCIANSLLRYEYIKAYFSNDLALENEILQVKPHTRIIPGQNIFKRLIQNQRHLESLLISNRWLYDVIATLTDPYIKSLNYCSFRIHLLSHLDHVISFKGNEKVSGKLEGLENSNLKLTGISLSFDRLAYEQCASRDFEKLKLHKLIPLFRIFQGICNIILVIHRECNKNGKFGADILDAYTKLDDLRLILKICEFMLVESNGFNSELQNFRGFLWLTIIKISIKLGIDGLQDKFAKMKEDSFISRDSKIILDRLRSRKNQITNDDDMNSQENLESNAAEIQVHIRTCKASINDLNSVKRKSKVTFDINNNNGFSLLEGILLILDFEDVALISNKKIVDDNGVISPKKCDFSELQSLFVEQLGILYYFQEIQKCYSIQTNSTSKILFRRSRSCSAFQGAIILNNPCLVNNLFINIELSGSPVSSTSINCENYNSRLPKHTLIFQGCSIWLAFWKENIIWKYIEKAFLHEEIIAANIPLLHPRSFLGSTPYDRCFFHEYFSYPYNSGGHCFSHPRCNGFYSIRRDAVESKLAEIENMSSHEIYFNVVSHFSPKTDEMTASYCMLDVPQLACLCVAIGGRRLKNILQGLLEFEEIFYRGAPDLLLFKVEGDGYDDLIKCCEMNIRAKQNEQDFKFCCTCNLARRQTSSTGNAGGASSSKRSKLSYLDSPTNIDYFNESVIAVEVKSKNDTVSEFQELWMQLLKASSIRAEFLKVTDL